MPSAKKLSNTFLITAKPDATDSDLRKLKEDVISKGGKITQEYTLIKGFSCELSEDVYIAYIRGDIVGTIERDTTVTTQN